MFAFKFAAWCLDPLADILGNWFLSLNALRPAFVSLYNAPLLPMTRFNNSIVMGSMLISIALAIPGFFVFRFVILHYRLQIVSRFEKSRFWKFVTATRFYKWYAAYNSLYA
jgi:uncharacterized protein (TIGR03546 family)